MLSILWPTKRNSTCLEYIMKKRKFVNLNIKALVYDEFMFVFDNNLILNKHLITAATANDVKEGD